MPVGGSISSAFNFTKTKASGAKSGTSALDERTDAVTKQASSKARDTTKESTQKQTAASTTTTDALTNLESLVSNLDADVQAGLKDLFAGLVESSGKGNLSELLTSRAKSADAAFDPSAIVAEAQRRGEEQVGQAEQKLAQGAGSSQNTLVQQFTLDERADVQSQVAALAAQLGIESRKAATAEIAGAEQTSQAGIGNIAGLLKGANQATTTAQMQTQKASELTEALTSLFESGRETELADLLQTLAETKKATQKIDESVSSKQTVQSFSLAGSGFAS